MTIASLGLAAYAFYTTTGIGNSARWSESQTLSNMAIHLENHLNMTNQEIYQLESLIATLDTRINTINADVISQGALINTLTSRLHEWN